MFQSLIERSLIHIANFLQLSNCFGDIKSVASRSGGAFLLEPNIVFLPIVTRLAFTHFIHSFILHLFNHEVFSYF